MTKNDGVIYPPEMAEIEDWSLGLRFDDEEERLEYEEAVRKKDVLDPVEKKCQKCEDVMPSTRVKEFSVPAYQHMFSGSERRGRQRVRVCWYCLMDGWRPTSVTSNHMDVHWENVFNQTNQFFEDMIDDVKEEMVSKFEKVSQQKNPNILGYGVTPHDIGIDQLLSLYHEERRELRLAISKYENGKAGIVNVMEESIDLMNATFLIYWYFSEEREEEE